MILKYIQTTRNHIYMISCCLYMFLINDKRKNKGLVFELIYSIAMSYFFFLVIPMGKWIIVVLLDFLVKIIMMRGMVSDIRQLMYFPIQKNIKKTVLMLLPIISLLNISIVPCLYHGNYFLAFMILLNSWAVFEIKVYKRNQIPFCVMYSLLFIFWIYYRDLLWIPVVISVLILGKTLSHQYEKTLKYNR